jgi:DNA-binding NtrC family response regulator
MLARVLLALDDAALQRRLRRLLAQPDVIVETLAHKRDLGPELGRRSGDLSLISRSLVPEPAPEAIRGLRALPEAPEVVIFCRKEDSEDRARLLAAGASAVLTSDLSNPVLREVLSAILGRRLAQAMGGAAERRSALDPRLSDFFTSSPAMQVFMSLVGRVVASDTSLLILGETGVGKEHLARAIHAESPRAGGPFISVNCGALTETLLESELFGHEEGAFTGAMRARRGCFELAHRGTLFLDEICELPAHLQVNLLHVLQRREIQRLGSESRVAIDVRVMAATNRDIAEEVKAKRFRNDLYYRLSVVSLAIPPLRERREDIPALAEAYLDYYRPHIRRNVRRVAPDALEALQQYNWPGNVRELVNIIERAMLLSSGEEITLPDLPESVRLATAAADPAHAPLGTPPSAAESAAWLDESLESVRRRALETVERRYLDALLRATNGRIGETARRAGIQPRSLYEKMKRHGLEKHAYRATPGGTHGARAIRSD